MKRLIATLGIISLLWACNNTVAENEVVNHQEKVTKVLLDYQADFTQKTKEFDSVAKYHFSIENLKGAFLEARLAYKKVEPVIGHFYPDNTKRLNGAAIPYNSIYDNTYRVIEPTGFQVIEELLFDNEIDTVLLKEEIYRLSTLTAALENKLTYTKHRNISLFEGFRLQVLRIISLGLSGFDSPVAFYSLPEAISALDGLKTYLYVYASATQKQELGSIFGAAIRFIENSSDFDSFDRYAFIKEHEPSLSKIILDIQKSAEIPFSELTTVIDFKKESFSEVEVFNILHFAPPRTKMADSTQIALGKKLFFDPILSGNGSVSCASCHIPEQGYADKKRKVFENTQLEVNRNAPSLLTTAFQNNYFHDGRIPFIEDQAKSVINNKDEMHGSFGEALQRITNNSEYNRLFQESFEKGITEKNFLYAMASYLRDLPSFSSKFDQSLRNQATLTESEINGFNVFMGKAKCAICHFYPVFNGSVPPLYQETESEVIGVPSKKDTINATVDPDLGVYYVYGAPLKKFAFKTPTVRNTALTAPYMHNGVYDSLVEVIDFYNRGGGSGIGIELENQTLPFDNLNLSKKEIDDLIAFIHTLNDDIEGY